MGETEYQNKDNTYFKETASFCKFDNDGKLVRFISKKKNWQKPTLEDVSEKIMAQPYIRFT